MDKACYNRGDIYRTLGKYPEAIYDYHELIRLKPEMASAYIQRGYSYSKLNDMENTCKDFKKACELGDCRGLETLKKENKCQ